MKRIQFYPYPELDKKLEEDAQKRNLSASALVVDILSAYYGLTASNTLPLADLTQKVFTEVAQYIADPNCKSEFALSDASDTYNAIEMTGYRKPRTVRAKIGASFARLIGTPGPFADVAAVQGPNGKPKLNVNNAAVYKVSPPTIQASSSVLGQGLEFSYVLRNQTNEDVGRIISRNYFEEKVIVIDSFCVSQRWRNKGFGKALLQCVILEAQSKGYKYITVIPQPSEVYDDIPTMSKDTIIEVYRKLGFTEDPQSDNLVYCL